MYYSKKKIKNKGLATLKVNFNAYLKNNEYVYVKSLKRKVFLDKLPDAIINRGNAKKRLQCFWVACDVLKKECSCEKRLNGRKQKEFEIVGQSVEGFLVTIHIREEIVSKGKDRKLFFVSCFYNTKSKTPPTS